MPQDPPIPDSATTKQCTRCKRIKVVSEDKNESQFYIKKSLGIIRYDCWCKQCTRITQNLREIRPDIVARRSQPESIKKRKASKKKYVERHKDRVYESSCKYNNSLIGKLTRQLRYHRHKLEILDNENSKTNAIKIINQISELIHKLKAEKGVIPEEDT